MKLIWVLGLTACVGAGLGLEMRERAKTAELMDRLEQVQARSEGVSAILLRLERYTRESGSFRVMNNADILQARTEASEEIVARINKVQAVEPADASVTTAAAHIHELIWNAPIRKDDFRELHDATSAALNQAQSEFDREETALRAERKFESDRMLQARFAIAGVALLFLAAWLLQDYLALRRPMLRVRKRLARYAQGDYSAQPVSKPGLLSRVLPATFAADLERSLERLAEKIEQGRAERTELLTALARDLQAPIAELSRTVNQEVERGSDPALRDGVARINRAVEDLLDFGKGEVTLEERVVDLREVLERARDTLASAGARTARVVVDGARGSAPVWALVDPERLGRVVANLAARIATLSRDATIELALCATREAGAAGAAGAPSVEISVREAGAEAQSRFRPSAPVQDLANHWSSRKETALAVADRIVGSHGGSLKASGLAGGRIGFAIRLPEQRIACAIQPA